MHKLNVMLDLETMGTGNNSAIVAIGAVFFDHDGVDTDDSFYQTIDLSASVNDGGVIDPLTVRWWMAQSEEARKEVVEGKAHIRGALYALNEWIMKRTHGDSSFKVESVTVWGNGATFDNVIIRSAYNRAKIGTVWSFRDDACYRTIKNMFPEVPFEPYGTAHNALDDAIAQASHMVRILARMQEGAHA